MCQQHKYEIPRALERCRKQTFHGRVEFAKEVVRAADCRSKVEKVGVLFCRVPALQDQTTLEGKDWVRCESMQSEQACAAHRRQAHGITAPSIEAAGGRACMICRREFWTTKQLNAQLYRMPQCLHVHKEADFPPITPQELMHGALAWKPVTNFIGPCPFWATLRPSRRISEASLDK